MRTGKLILPVRQVHRYGSHLPHRFVTNMAPPTPSLAEIRFLIERDLLASNELAARITQLRQDITDGNPPSSSSIAIMDSSNKDRARQISSLIEELGDKTVGDRELLQALTARQVICDRHGMQLAELRDLEFEARGEREEVVLRPSESPPRAGLSGASSLVDMDLHADHAEPSSSAQDDDAASGSGSPQCMHQDDTAVQDLEKDLEPDLTSSWPLLYRILNIDPKTPQDRFKPACDR